MDWTDHRAVARWATLQNARARIAYGKNFSAREFARKITGLREMLAEKYGTLSRGVRALNFGGVREWAAQMEKADVVTPKDAVFAARLVEIDLVKLALTNPKVFGSISKAFGKLGEENVVDPRADAIITAYEHCESFPPTFGQLKRTFIARFGESRWRGDYSVRKTLRSLRLPLSKSKRGRPIGSKSQI